MGVLCVLNQCKTFPRVTLTTVSIAEYRDVFFVAVSAANREIRPFVFPAVPASFSCDACALQDFLAAARSCGCFSDNYRPFRLPKISKSSQNGRASTRVLLLGLYTNC